jgi:hypothetical protein
MGLIKINNTIIMQKIELKLKTALTGKEPPQFIVKKLIDIKI